MSRCVGEASANDSHIAEYLVSPDSNWDISCTHVACINQWKCHNSLRGKTSEVFDK